MPALAGKPPTTFPEGASVARMNGTWWVAHTRSRQEKAFAHDLSRRGVSHFLPLIERPRVARGTRRVCLAPLFPSYVFVCASEQERIGALKGGRLARTIRVADQGRLVRELSQIQEALAARATFQLCPYLRKGRRCRITGGPFAGLEGVIARHKGASRLVLTVESLGQAVALEVDAALMEAVD